MTDTNEKVLARLKALLVTNLRNGLKVQNKAVAVDDLDAAIRDIEKMLAEPVTVWHIAGLPPDGEREVLATDGTFVWVTPYTGEWFHGPMRYYPTHWAELPPLPEVQRG